MLNLLKKDYETLKAQDIDPKKAKAGPSSNEAIQSDVEKAKVQPNSALPDLPPPDPNAPTKMTNNQKKRQAKKFKKKMANEAPAEPASNWPHSGWKDENGASTGNGWDRQSPGLVLFFSKFNIGTIRLP